MALQAPEGHEKEAPQLEVMTRMVMKSYAEAASRGYSWRAFSTFRFMENCLVELLRLEDATAYRVSYAYVRQLALILRNSCLQVTHASGSAKDKARSKVKAKEEKKGKKAAAKEEKRKGQQAGSGSTGGSRQKGSSKQQLMQQQGLVTWPFVRSIYFWSKAVGSLPALKPLAYPLFMVIMGAIKTKLTALQYFPFVYHCLHCLNRLGSMLEVFVPISSHLLKSLDVLFRAMEKARKKRAGAGPKGLEVARAPELEVLLRLGDGQVLEMMTLETIGSSLCFLFTDHLGLLSQSPSFPEISAIVLMHLKKHVKHCPSETLRHQLKNVISVSEASAEDVRARREALTEVPSFKKFLIFEADTALAKARASALQRRAAEDKGRVEAEMREEAKAEEGKTKGKGPSRDGAAASEEQGTAPQGQAAPGLGISRKAARRRKLREEKERASGAAVEAQDEQRSKKRRGPTPAEAAVNPGRDRLEEMGFSDSE